MNLESDEKLVSSLKKYFPGRDERAMNQSGESLLHLIGRDQGSRVKNQTLQILNNSINWRDLLSTPLFQVKVSPGEYLLFPSLEAENINVLSVSTTTIIRLPFNVIFPKNCQFPQIYYLIRISPQPSKHFKTL